MTASRSRLLAVLATIAVVLVIVVGIVTLTQRTEENPRAGSEDPTSTGPSETTEPEASESAEPAEPESSASPSEAAAVVPVYYVTETDKAGPRLVREFHRVAGDPFEGALHELTSAAPQDDGYVTLWPGGDFGSVSFDGVGSNGVITVTVPEGEWTAPAPGMTRREAELAVQQVAYTLQGVAQARARLMFVTADGKPVRTLLGQDVADGVTQASALQTLNLINITSPASGETLSGSEVVVTGVVNSFEGSGGCVLLAGDEEVASAVYQAEGWMEEKLFPFEVTLPLSDAGTGDVVVRCQTDDPTGGTEGFGTFTDDKLVTVR